MSTDYPENQSTPNPDDPSTSPPDSTSPGDADAVEMDWEDDDVEEFSLSQLSEAYAQVIEAQTGRKPNLAVDAAAGSDDLDQDAGDDEDAEEDDEAICPVTPESIVEAILFVGAPTDVKLTSRKIAAILRDVSPKEVTQIVRKLNEKYEQQNAAFRVTSKGGVLEMVLDPQLSSFQLEFHGRNRQARLSQAAIDVMAIVAYNQPTTREQVDKVRGKPSGSVLSQLVRRELIAVEDGKEDARVRYYSTTERFLDLFRLDNVSDLPQSHDVTDIAELAD